MLMASSSQMPRGMASRNASPAAMMPARTSRAVLRLVSGSPRVGSLPRGPKSSASRAPRRRCHKLASRGFRVRNGRDSNSASRAWSTPLCAASARRPGYAARVNAVDVEFPENLGRLALFVDLPKSELEAIAAGCEQVSFREGEWIVRQGDPQSAVYLIVEGEVAVVINDEDRRVLPQGELLR